MNFFAFRFVIRRSEPGGAERVDLTTSPLLMLFETRFRFMSASELCNIGIKKRFQQGGIRMKYNLKLLAVFLAGMGLAAPQLASAKEGPRRVEKTSPKAKKMPLGKKRKAPGNKQVRKSKPEKRRSSPGLSSKNGSARSQVESNIQRTSKLSSLRTSSRKAQRSNSRTVQERREERSSCTTTWVTATLRPSHKTRSSLRPSSIVTITRCS